jgi:hypothetical protein
VQPTGALLAGFKKQISIKDFRQLMKIEDDIIKIANQANLKISLDDQMISINQKIYFTDKLSWGLAFFFLGGICFILFPFIKSSDMTSTFLSVSTGLFFLIGSVMTIIRQASDSVQINDGKITFRYNLKKDSVHIDKTLKIKMKIELISISRVNAPRSSTFVEYYPLFTNN